MQVIPLAKTPKKKLWKKTKNKKKRKKRENTYVLSCCLHFFDHVLPPDGFVSIQIQLVVWHFNNLDRWPLFIFSLGFLLYLRCAIHIFEYGSQKPSIVTYILTFLSNFAFCCFLCFLICLFHVCFYFFHRFMCFLFFSFLFRPLAIRCTAWFWWL